MPWGARVGARVHGAQPRGARAERAGGPAFWIYHNLNNIPIGMGLGIRTVLSQMIIKFIILKLKLIILK